jgi:hypothetical protein
MMQVLRSVPVLLVLLALAPVLVPRHRAAGGALAARER